MKRLLATRFYFCHAWFDAVVRFSFRAMIIAAVGCALSGCVAARAQPAFSPGKHDLFMSPAGDDGAPGTEAAPLRTMAEAVSRLKKLRAEGPVTVWMRGGRYPVRAAVVIDSSVRGNIAFRAYPGEAPVLDASRAIYGFEETELNGSAVWVADVGALLAEMDFHTVYDTNGPLTNARAPKDGQYFRARFATLADAETIHFTPTGAIANTLRFKAFYVDEDMRIDLNLLHNKNDILIRMLHLWTDESSYLGAFDAADGRIELSRPTNLTVWRGDRYWLENVLEALSNPGEWYIDRVMEKLYYMPVPGQTADGFALYAGGVERMLTVDGRSRVTFSGITFTGTDWTIGAEQEFPQAAYDAQAAVFVSSASNVAFEGCVFRNLGGTALKLYQGVTDSEVTDCRFENVGANAIFAHGVNLAEDKRRTERLVISGNTITRYGRNDSNAVGILLVHVANSEISHNEIFDGYYTAISAGWVWGYAYSATSRLTISDNLIYNIGQGRLSDMGGIYLLGRQSGTVVERNIIHDVRSHIDNAYGSGYGGWGVYLDEGASGITIRQNLVYDCGSQGLHVNYGRDNKAENNIFANSAGGQIAVTSGEDHAAITLKSNIIVGSAQNMFAGSPEGSIVSQSNLYWDPHGTYSLMAQTLEQSGFDSKSVIADPGFVNEGAGDFSVAADSPAHGIGFAPWLP